MKKHRSTVGLALALFLGIAVLNLGLAGCGGSDSTTPTPTGPTPTTSQQGLQVRNIAASVAAFYGVRIFRYADTSEQVFTGMNVAPGGLSQVFPLNIGLHAFATQIQVGGIFQWLNYLDFTVNQNQVTLVEVIIS